MKAICPLCSQENKLFFQAKVAYYKCQECYGIYQDKNTLLDSTQEKERYELHDDDTQDAGYRKFVSPMSSAITKDFSQDDEGLDFGAGACAIIATILHESDYKIQKYDPYFHNTPALLQKKYAYVSSCEVIEHFYTPYKEFALLHSLLQEKGKLYLMTELYHEGIDFATWYYKNDPTHVFFYALETFEWIQKKFGFRALHRDKRLIILEK